MNDPHQFLASIDLLFKTHVRGSLSQTDNRKIETKLNERDTWDGRLVSFDSVFPSKLFHCVSIHKIDPPFFFQFEKNDHLTLY
jgi:hypothetical protein